MSFSRKELVAMGIEADTIERLIQMNAASVAWQKDRIAELEEELEKASGYKKDAETLVIVQKELDELKKQVEADAKEREDKDYDKLLKEFEDYKAEQERIATRQAKEAAYKEIMKDVGIPERHFEKILKYSDVDGVELDEKGKITTKKEILKSLKEDWGDHIETTTTQGADIQNPPESSGNNKMTIQDIYKRGEDGQFILNASERQKAIAENMEQFNN